VLSRISARLLTGPPGFLLAGAIDLIIFALWVATRRLKR
jgi:hypothetical protein